MKILFISDTHKLHRKLKNLPEADLLIHGGDVSQTGADHEVEDFIRWFSGLNYKHKVFIAGNHDFYLEELSVERIRKMLPENTYYLCNNGITIEGINIWGSPITPTHHNWAFNRDRGNAIRKYWKMIPQNTDILITHGPPSGILDNVQQKESVGCRDLYNVIRKVKPCYHLFGHIHEEYGTINIDNTTFINGSIMNGELPPNSPVVFEINSKI